MTELFCSSGIDEAEMTEVQKLITSVAKLQELKPHKHTKDLYSKKDRSEADCIREAAVKAAEISDSSDAEISSDVQDLSQDNRPKPISATDSNSTPKQGIPSAAEAAALNKFFSSENEDDDEHKPSTSSGGRPTPKRELVRYLENKTEVICNF